MVEKIAMWMPVSQEVLDDAAPTKAWIEYGLFSTPAPLTLRERLTGWRSFTSSDGYTITFRVGWRASLYWLTHPIENWRRHHPPKYGDEPEWWD